MKKNLAGILAKVCNSMVIYPVLLAIFPVLFLYTFNIKQTAPQAALSPLWFIVPATILIWLLIYLWMKNIFKSALATALLVVLFFSYGRLYGYLEKLDMFVPSHGILLPLLVLIWAYLVYFIKKARRDFKSTTTVLNVVTIVLILINVFNITEYQINKPASVTEVNRSQPKAAVGNDDPSINQPDIYWIILDEYTNPEVMKNLYGYDDSEFLNSLKDHGFYVAPDSKMHNEETIRAIASILNMEYTPETEDPVVTYQRIENNAVVNFLQSQGYQYIYFGHWYEEDRYKIPADFYYNFYKAAEKGSLTTEYSSILWNTTALSPFYNYISGNHYQGYFRDSLLNTLDQMKKVPQIPGPKFTYAHLICPHGPFVFGPDGEQVPSTHYYNVDDKQYYLGQYIFISRQIDKVIEDILKTSSRDPIIIVQSDHGPRWNDQWNNILNAYHLPQGGNDLLYPNISPINSFRLIFNHYFQAHYDMLEDK